MAGQRTLSFAGLLRQLRAEARLTQEELAEAAGVSPRSVSDLERGLHATAHKDTALLLAGALGLDEPTRDLFVAAARGRAMAAEVLAARGAGTPGAGATRALPRDIASFTGRQAELARLTRALAGVAADGGVVRIHAVDGMAGIGKTTFAVHAAHQLAGSFPDGQFFLPLHAHTPGQRPVHPADALASLLLTAGLAAALIPPGLEARAARWRDHTAGKKVLLLLDDAAGHEQVRPLLPGTAGSLVLITSRRRLAALEDATVITLDPLTPGEAAALLAGLAARPTMHAGDAAVQELARLCGYLPLALGMLASQLRHHPAWTPAELAAGLTAARDRLELMQAENLSVAAAFGLSYADLTGGQQRLFRRLGLIPGPTFDAHAAAALDGTSLEAARRGLAGLYDQHLLTELAPGRYLLHDLLREHARVLAAADDPADRDAATGRLLDFYVHTALVAGRQIATRVQGTRPPPLTRPPACAPRLSTANQAATWLTAERGNLHAATEYAAAHGYHQHAAQIPAAISAFLLAEGSWDQAAALHQTALTAARHAGDRRGQADALNQLCIVQVLSGDIPAGTANQRQALALYRDLGDRLGQGDALHSLGLVHERTDDYPAAAASFEQALTLYREAGDLAGQGDSLSSLGFVQLLAADFRAAAANLKRALALFSDLGDRFGQSLALSSLGGLQTLTGDYLLAGVSLQRALELCRDLGDLDSEANAIARLGSVHRLTGDYQSAAVSLRQALELFGKVGDRVNQACILEEFGVLHRLTGDYPAAAASLGQALDLFRDLGDRRGQGDVLNELGALQVLTGDYPAAAASLGQALDLFRHLGARHCEAEALNNLGELLSRRSASHGAQNYYAAALAIARDLGTPVEEARALEGIGQCRILSRQPRRRRGAATRGTQHLPAHRGTGRPARPGDPPPPRADICHPGAPASGFQQRRSSTAHARDTLRRSIAGDESLRVGYRRRRLVTASDPGKGDNRDGQACVVSGQGLARAKGCRLGVERRLGRWPGQCSLSFAGLLRQLRTEARPPAPSPAIWPAASRPG